MEFSTPQLVDSGNASKEPSGLIEILADDRDDEKIKTFILHGEDHTLGNALRWVLMKEKDVQFCGYTVPHPSQREIHLRIQTFKRPAVDVLRTALTRLSELMQLISDRVKDKASQFESKTEQEGPMET